MTPADVVSDAIFFKDILILLVAAVLAVLALARLGGSPVVGYILAGLAIGPGGFALLSDRTQIDHYADVGVIFLMFMIGLELSFSRLKAMRYDVFGLGFLQLAGTMAVVAGLAYLNNGSLDHALIIGGALALSSTAVVLRLLVDQGQLSSAMGRKAFAILLFQDLAVVPLILFVDLQGGSGVGTALGLSAVIAVGQAFVTLVVVIGIGRLLLRPLFRAVAAIHSHEIFTATALLMLFGIATAMEAVGLSMELGAFIAGLLIAETEYRESIQRDIEPFQGLLLALFFITVGMNLDARFVVGHLGVVLGVLVIVVLAKGLIITLLGLLFRLSLGDAVRLGLTLAQIGEFAFVLLGLAADRFLEPESAQMLYVVGGLSLAITPLLAHLGARWQAILKRRHSASPGPSLAETARRLEGHVVIAGFGRVGQAVAALLQQDKLAYIALDIDPDYVGAAVKRGQPVFYGDSARPPLLQSAGIERAAAAVVTTDNPAATAATVRAIRMLAADIPVLVRAHDRGHCMMLETLGATVAVPEALEASLQLGGRVLEALGRPPALVGDMLADFRADHYAEISEAEEKGRISPD